MTSAEQQRWREHFESHWAAWLTVHHFLPATLLRDLFIVVGRCHLGVATPENALGNVVTASEPGFDSWVLIPKPKLKEDEAVLFELARSTTWQGDWYETGSKEGAPAQDVAAALALGRADFGAIRAKAEHSFTVTSGTANVVWHLLRVASAEVAKDAGSDLWAIVSAALDSTPEPLASILTKHVADLCADEDRWPLALAGYQKTRDALLAWPEDSRWATVCPLWLGVVEQSIASALSVTQGAKAAADHLSGACNSPSANALLRTNASHDLNVFCSAEGLSKLPPDRRTYVGEPPLLLQRYDSSSATSYCLRGEYRDAHRWFWAQLRRQLALGSSVAAMNTMGLYALSLLDELAHEFDKRTDSRGFELAIGLLIASERVKIVGCVRWHGGWVNRYVDNDVVERLVTKCDTYEGVRHQRTQVLVSVLGAWTMALPVERADTTRRMLDVLANIALRFPVTFEGTTNTGGDALKELLRVLKSRPELREVGADPIAEACIERLQKARWWHERALATEVLTLLADVLSPANVSLVLDAVLAEMRSGNWDTGPRGEFFNLLCTDRFNKAMCDSADMVGEVVRLVLVRDRATRNTDAVRVLRFVRNIDIDTLEVDEKGAVEAAIDSVRAGALEMNCSSAPSCICSLLLNARRVGKDAVRDALAGLRYILQSVQDSGDAALGFGVASDCVFVLAEEMLTVSQTLGADGQDEAQSILSELLRMWRSARQNPSVFIPYSLPRQDVASVVSVHNWAFASLILGSTLGCRTSVDEALGHAAEGADLREGIALARVGRRRKEVVTLQDLTPIVESSSTETFYSGLGRVLAVLALNDELRTKATYEQLLSRCLRFGPRVLDVAVLVEAHRLGLSAPLTSLSAYIHRAEQDREVRLAVIPVAALLERDADGSGE